LDASERFAQNFVKVGYKDLPQQVVEETKKQILDFIGVALAGAAKSGAVELRELSLEWGGAEQSRIFSWGEKVSAPNAAQINATMGHSLDFDDVHEAAVMHPGVVTIPTALAIADYKGGLSGQDLINAVALGGDMICRFGLATRPGQNIHAFGWHFTSLNGFMTAAAVAAKLLGLDEDGIVSAIGIGYHQASGNGQAVKDGALTKRLGPGFSVKGGITAALLAQKGVTGARNSIEGISGYYNVYHAGSYSPEILYGELGTRYESANISIKPYPCCRGVHPFIDAAMHIVNEHGVTADDVESIMIWCGKGTYGLLGAPLEVKAKPRNHVDSQFSLAWGVATYITKRRATMQDFTEDAIRDPEVLAVAAKIDVQYDPALDKTDDIEPAKVAITTKNGKTYTDFVEHPTGTPARPLSFADCERKFQGCIDNAERKVPAENAEKIATMVKQLEKVNDVKEFLDLLAWK